MSKRVDFTAEMTARLHAMWSEGATLPAIGAKLGVSKGRLWAEVTAIRAEGGGLPNRRRLYDAAEIAEVRARGARGETGPQIAAALGRAVKHLQALAVAHGIALRAAGTADWSKADKAEAKRMFLAGATPAVIAAALGNRVQPGAIKQYLWARGITRAQGKATQTAFTAGLAKPKRQVKPRFWTDVRLDELVRLVGESLSDKALMAHFGVSGHSITNRISKLRAEGRIGARHKPAPPKQWTLEAQRALLQRAVHESNEELATAYACAVSSIVAQLVRARRALEAAGEAVPARHKVQPHAERNAQILRLWAQGLASADIQDRLNLSAGVVGGVLCRQGGGRRPSRATVLPKAHPERDAQGAKVDARGVAIVDAPLPKLRPIVARPAKPPLPPVHLAKPADTDALPCRIRLGGELLNINGTGATRDPAYHWRGTVRQARNLITRNALQGAVIEQLSTGAHGGRA
jgi:hypothetical protein